MIIGKPKSDNIPLLQIDGRQIERVSHFKILGLYNFLITYSGIGMSNTYATKSHPSYNSSNSLNELAYHQTTCSTSMLQ